MLVIQEIVIVVTNSWHFVCQEQVEEMKKKEERMEKQMAEVIAENKRLTEPLQKAREEVEDLRKQLANYEKDKETLRVSTSVAWRKRGGLDYIRVQSKYHSYIYMTQYCLGFINTSIETNHSY